MFDQHVYILTHDTALPAALTDGGIATTAFADAESLVAALTPQPRGLVIVDLQLPRGAGFAFLRDSHSPGMLPVVVFTTEGDVAGTVEGMRHGAVDVIEKPYNVTNVVARVRAALQRESASWQSRRQSLSVAHRLKGLTPREAEVLGQLSLGLSNRQTGERLGISPRTVEVHRGRIMGKMGAGSMTSLVRMVVEAGLGGQLPALPPVL